MTQTNTLTAGIDTSKDKLDVAIHGSTTCWHDDNTAAGWQRIAERLTAAGVTRVGIEATGGYERGVVRHLRERGFTVLVLQPMQVKAYARMHLHRAKNDAIDAGLIAACTAGLEPPAIPPDARLEALAGHLTFVEQIEEDKVRLKTRLEHTDDPRLRRVIKADIAELGKRRATEAINERLRPIRARRAELMGDRGHLRQVLLEGSAAARVLARDTLAQVSAAIHTQY